MNIFYLGYFSIPELGIDTECAMSASGVFLSVLDSIKRVSLNDHVIGINFARPVRNDEKEKFFSSNGIDFICRRVFFKKSTRIDNFFANLWLEKTLKSRIQKGDVLIVYHSLTYMPAIKRILQMKKCKIILNVEEFYSDFMIENSAKTRKKEESYFSLADGFILSTNSMIRERCFQKKPACFVYGDYRKQKFDCSAEKIPNSLVYAGTFDPIKGGIQNAIKVLTFLPKDFQLYVLSSEDPRQLNELITNLGLSSRIHFEGKKTGKMFFETISRYEIGLALQQSSSLFNQTSFPSKIINYLKAGLVVVSTPSESVTSTLVAKYVNFSKTDDPIEIAKTICNIGNQKHENCLDYLKTDFENKLQNLIREM